MSNNLKQTLTAANAPAGNLKELDTFLQKHKAQFALALPKHLNQDRMIRLALTAFSQNKALMGCSMTSVAASIITASQMGLEIGVAGQGYLVPYKGTCQFVPGWQGVVDLVNRAGRAAVWTGAVFDGDEFDYALGDAPYVKHRPGGENDPKKLLYTYAIGRINGSQWPVIEVWSQQRLLNHFHKFNKVGDRHYANTNWEMYVRKIPLLQVCKYMPKSIELNTAINIEGAIESGKAFTMDGEFAVLEGADASAEHDQGQQSAPAVTLDDVRKAMDKAASPEQLDEAWNMLGVVANKTADDERELGELYTRRDAALRK